MTGRIRCCVPFCRRTTAASRIAPDDEWICGIHWRGVSARTKKRRRDHSRFIRRELRREPLAASYWKLPPGSRERIKAVRMFSLSAALWRRCIREAIEAAGGIG